MGAVSAIALLPHGLHPRLLVPWHSSYFPIKLCLCGEFVRLIALSLLPQPLVLLWREVEEDPAAPLGDRLVESLAAGQVRQSAAALDEPDQRIRIGQYRFAGQGSL